MTPAETAAKEILHHTEEAERLHQAADLLATDAEYHLRQVETWQQYLGSLTLPTQRGHLTLIQGEA